jgi:hypothetical protein
MTVLVDQELASARVKRWDELSHISSNLARGRLPRFRDRREEPIGKVELAALKDLRRGESVGFSVCVELGKNK